MKISYLFLVLLSNLLILIRAYSQDNSGGSGTMDFGQCLLPVPQQVSLLHQQYKLDDSWTIEGGKLSNDDPAVLSLVSELKERFGVRLTANGSSIHHLRLLVNPAAVFIGKTIDTNRAALIKQAYRLKLEPGRISITANAPQGLFYGVQTLLQLLQAVNGNTYYAAGEIVDWPVMNLRMIYWDDAHHLERLDAMKRVIRQASYYKINAFSLKLEGHFQFSAAKPVVEPYAYTSKEYQELTDYAKGLYIELVPYLDAPAHIAFILKHPEYEGLRAFANSNYELSVTSEKADELILGMFDDLMKANKGGKYIFLSTDEAYYVGKAAREKERAEALGGNGRLLAESIKRISDKLHEKGRKVIIWGEYPLTPADVNFLPSYLINGINGNSDDFGSKFKEHGIRHLVFTSTQGEEPMFPNYYKLPIEKLRDNGSRLFSSEEITHDEMSAGRVGEVVSTITSSIQANRSDFLGVVVCGWADAGLNPETFWLGYATGSAVAWNLDTVNVENLANRFYRSFYGYKMVNMDKVYRLLSIQAAFWADSWDWKASQNRTPIFGYSAGIFDIPKQAKDQTLTPLPVPSPKDLSLNVDWNNLNQERLNLAEKYLKENTELLKLLQKNLAVADHQQYNLQVFLSIAFLCRQNLNMLLSLKRINDFLNLSSKASVNPPLAISLVDQAVDQLQGIRDDRNKVLQFVTSVWYQDWYPRVPEANGRKYLDKVDDVKDHLPVRTVDMSYLIYRQLKYPLDKWAEEVSTARNEFAQKNNVPVNAINLDWRQIKN